MVTVDDIAGVVLGRTTAIVAYSGLAWFGRGPEEPAGYPYAVFTVEGDPVQHTSGDAYLQAFRVTLAAYWPVGHSASPSAIQSIQQAFDDCFCTTAAQAALLAHVFRNATEKVIGGKSVRPTGDYEKELREGKDVFVCRHAAELLIQGDRSVS